MTEFKSRHRIEGVLITRTPLHIGDGTPTERSGCEYLRDGEKKPVEISAVATDAQGRAYIPGTTLKGNLRSWAGSRATDLAAWNEVFGRQELGGKAEFWDAHCVGMPANFNPGRCWSVERLTSVAASVAIDRRTRTASDRRLFHREFVPPGIEFGVTITAQDLSEAELGLLLEVLDGFNASQEPVTLGGQTSDQWGCLQWKLKSVQMMDTHKVSEWLKSQQEDVINSSFQKFSVDCLPSKASHNDAPANAQVTIDLALQFSGLFLVNDPSQIRTGTDPLGHAPTNDEKERPYLPASSFRGSLRSQAEMILRTIGGPSAAWRPGERGLIPEAEAIEKIGQLKDLCLVSQVFGAPGWRTPIHVSDFVLGSTDEARYITHEMLAIDRFTGGSPEGLKFNAKAVCRPCLQGGVTVDLDALERAGAGPAGLLLLVFTLRDLIEGDIAFGFGAGKGYGACRAKVQGVRWPEWERIPEVFRKDLSHEDVPDLTEGKAANEILQIKLFDWFDELIRSAKRRVDAVS